MKNKEMLYIKQNGDCYIDRDCKWGNMNKEDKIKELAKDMGIGFQLSGTTRFGPVAAELVEMGYQRIKKDDIVISKEEYQKDFSSQFNKGYKHGSKETAEKLIAKIKQFLSSVETIRGDNENKLQPEIYYKCSEVDDFLDEIEKQLSVEI